MGGRLLDYIAQGAAADRPLAADMPAKIAAGAASFYFAFDTGTAGVLSIFDADAVDWVDIDVGGGGGSFQTLTDVDWVPPTDGQVFVWDTGTGKLIPTDFPAGSYQDLSDVDWGTPPTDGQVFVWDTGTSKFVPIDFPSGGVSQFQDLTDVDWSTPPTDGQMFVWDSGSSKLVPADVPGGGVAPSIVQSKSAVGNNGSITLGANPTPGNLLIALGTHWSTSVTVTPGWFTLLNVPGGADGTVILAKVADAGDLAALSPYGAVAGACLTVFEVQDWNGAIFLPFNYKQETVGTAVGVNFAAPMADVLLVGHAATLSTNVAPTSVTNATAVGTSVAGVTANASPRQATPWYKTFSAKGGITITANYAASSNQYIAGVAVIPAG